MQYSTDATFSSSFPFTFSELLAGFVRVFRDTVMALAAAAASTTVLQVAAVWESIVSGTCAAEGENAAAEAATEVIAGVTAGTLSGGATVSEDGLV